MRTPLAPAPEISGDEQFAPYAPSPSGGGGGGGGDGDEGIHLAAPMVMSRDLIKQQAQMMANRNRAKRNRTQQAAADA